MSTTTQGLNMIFTMPDQLHLLVLFLPLSPISLLTRRPSGAWMSSVRWRKFEIHENVPDLIPLLYRLQQPMLLRTQWLGHERCRAYVHILFTTWEKGEYVTVRF